jgi:hypothetical protein
MESLGLPGLESTLLALPPSEKARLAVILLDSLDDEADGAVEAAWLAEVARRDHALSTQPDLGRDARDVFRDARARLR